MWEKIDFYRYKHTETGAFINKIRVRDSYVCCLFESQKTFQSLDGKFIPFKNLRLAQKAGEKEDFEELYFQSKAA